MGESCVGLFLWIFGGKKHRQEMRRIRAWEEEQYRLLFRSMDRGVALANQALSQTLDELEGSLTGEVMASRRKA